MKKQATIIRWNPTRGFGFMRSSDTPADVFFHVKDWTGRGEQPVEGLAVVYEEIHVGGKGPRGVAVRPARQAQPAIGSPRNTRLVAGHSKDAHPGAALFLILAYMALLVWCAVSGRLPPVVPLCLLLLNGATFFVYWFDKFAAQRGAWRTSEQALHVLGFLGGWVGAWFAHRLLRHKSRKPSFRAAYWGTVAAHWAAMLTWLIVRDAT